MNAFELIQAVETVIEPLLQTSAAEAQGDLRIMGPRLTQAQIALQQLIEQCDQDQSPQAANTNRLRSSAQDIARAQDYLFLGLYEDVAWMASDASSLLELELRKDNGFPPRWVDYPQFYQLS